MKHLIEFINESTSDLEMVQSASTFYIFLLSRPDTAIKYKELHKGLYCLVHYLCKLGIMNDEEKAIVDKWQFYDYLTHKYDLAKIVSKICADPTIYANVKPSDSDEFIAYISNKFYETCLHDAIENFKTA